MRLLLLLRVLKVRKGMMQEITGVNGREEG